MPAKLARQSASAKSNRELPTAVEPRATDLLGWYERHARRLPWRIGPKERRAGVRPDPYRVWLSEVMLQQTTVKAAAPYFERFVSRWPNVQALAASDEHEIMSAWAGLGYYSRARNLIACARMVVSRTDGRFPGNAEDLSGLPGIGTYTSAAIAAIAFNEPTTVIDGNVERVITRLHAIDTPFRRQPARRCRILPADKARGADGRAGPADVAWPSPPRWATSVR